MIKKLLKTGICVFCVYCLIVESDSVKRCVASSVEVWCTLVLPSVFPYLILAQYVSASDIFDMNGHVTSLIAGKILGISPCSMRAVISSFVCGYPSGAVCAASLFESRNISQKEAARLIGFTNNAGPLFLIAGIGEVFLGSARDGAAIYIIAIVSSLLWAVFSARKNTLSVSLPKKAVRTDFNFCVAVGDAVSTIINICAFMICANIFSEMSFCFLKNVFQTDTARFYTEVFLKAFFEISEGTNAIAASLEGETGFGFVCAAVSWSGFSVILQIKHRSHGLVSFREIIKPKLIQSCLSFIFGYVYKAFTQDAPCSFTNRKFLFVSLLISGIIFAVYLAKCFSEQKKNCQKIFQQSFFKRA